MGTDKVLNYLGSNVAYFPVLIGAKPVDNSAFLPTNSLFVFNSEITDQLVTQYNDGATSTPVDGIGGTPTFVYSFALTNPLKGTSDLFTENSTNLLGQGFSFDFNLPRSAEGLPNLIEMSYDYSGVDGDWACFLYDKANANFISPIIPNSHIIKNGSQLRLLFAWNVPTTSKTFRFIVHRTVSTATNNVLRLGDIISSFAEIPYYVSTDGTFALNSDLKVPTEKATKTFSSNASNLLTGTVSASRLPLALSNSTSINGLAITASTGVLNISGGSTFTVNNSIALSGTNGTTITLPSVSGTVALNNQTVYIGTTGIAINRGSGALALTGITSIDGTASALTTARSIGISGKVSGAGVNFDGSGNITINTTSASILSSEITDATHLNTFNMVVKRDGSGNFTAGTITASLSGTASVATNVGVTNDLSTPTTVYPTWLPSSSGNDNIRVSSTKLSFVPSTGILTATGFVGSVSGNATSATNLLGGNSNTLLGSIPYQSNVDSTTLLAPNTTTTRKFLRQTGTGTNGAVPSWDTIQASDIPTGISITGNANTATALQTARTIAISGKVTGTATSFDGSADITISTTAVSILSADVTDATTSAQGNKLVKTDANGRVAVSSPVLNYEAVNKGYMTFNAVSLWDSTVTYGINDLVFKSGTIYKSKITPNVNHDPSTDSTFINWDVASGGGAGSVSNMTVGTNAVSAFKFVYTTASGTVQHADSALEGTSTVIGVTSSGGSSGASVIVQTSGLLKNFSTGMTPGNPIFLGLNGGFITDPSTIPIGSYRVLIGYAVTSTDLLINIAEPFQMLSTTSTVRVGLGRITQWTAPLVSLPGNYIPLSGQAISRTIYADLFTLWGTTYGPGDGSTTFNVPDWSNLNVKDNTGTTVGYWTAQAYADTVFYKDATFIGTNSTKWNGGVNPTSADVGNASGNIPLNNGTLNLNLNAEKISGMTTGAGGTDYIPYVNSSSRMLVGNGSGDDGYGQIQINTDSTKPAAISFKSANISNASRYWSIATNYTYAGDMVFRRSTAWMGNPYSAGATIMSLTPSGNLNVGSDVDTIHRITAVGSIRATTSLYATNTTTYGSSPNTSVIIGSDNSDAVDNTIPYQWILRSTGSASSAILKLIANKRVSGEADAVHFASDGITTDIARLGALNYYLNDVNLSKNGNKINFNDTLVPGGGGDYFLPILQSRTSINGVGYGSTHSFGIVRTSTANFVGGFYMAHTYTAPDYNLNTFFRVWNQAGATLLESSAADLQCNNNFTPWGDAQRTLGSGAKRWTTVFATTGTINTSDARKKTEVAPFSQDEINASMQMGKEIGTYQWLASVAEKGADKARHHVGLTVQRAIDIMTMNNLDPMKYGFICYDEWDDEIQHIDAQEAKDAVYDADGRMIEPAIIAREAQDIVVKEAGNVYSFRYDELNLFIARGFEARLSALEARL